MYYYKIESSTEPHTKTRKPMDETVKAAISAVEIEQQEYIQIYNDTIAARMKQEEEAEEGLKKDDES